MFKKDDRSEYDSYINKSIEDLGVTENNVENICTDRKVTYRAYSRINAFIDIISGISILTGLAIFVGLLWNGKLYQILDYVLQWLYSHYIDDILEWVCSCYINAILIGVLMLIIIVRAAVAECERDS